MTRLQNLNSPPIYHDCLDTESSARANSTHFEPNIPLQKPRKWQTVLQQKTSIQPIYKGGLDTPKTIEPLRQKRCLNWLVSTRKINCHSSENTRELADVSPLLLLEGSSRSTILPVYKAACSDPAKFHPKLIWRLRL